MRVAGTEVLFHRSIFPAVEPKGELEIDAGQRIAKLGLGFSGAGAAVILGLWLWQLGQPWQRVAALCPLAFGQIVLMRLVADDLFPRATLVLTKFLKQTAALVFWLAALVSLWLISNRG